MDNFNKLHRESIERMEKLSTSIDILGESMLLYKKKLDSAMDRVIKEVDPESWRYYHADIYSTYDEIETDLPSVLRHSVLVHVYSVFESILNNLCVIHKNKKNLNLSLSDLKHDGIARAKVYIKKVSCSPFNEESQEWSEIIKINKLRNILAHNDGVILEEKHQNYNVIKQYIDSTTGLEISDNGKISIGSIYVTFVLTTFKTYLSDLFDKQKSEFEN